MPTHTGKDSKGCYARWGGHGKKYYYQCGNEEARKRAVKKANRQGQAAHAHGYVGNQGDDMRTFQRVVSNLQPLVRHDSMEGRDWLVAPTQMITEGVHNGSDGPIFYPADELAKLPSAWNHMPVVVYHPVVNGVSVSARTPEQLTSRKIGVLMNTQWDGETKKLATETWLDPARIVAVDNRVAEAIENNEMMEVSTGLYMSLERKEGDWNGEHYDAIAHELQPDHLALLPDQLGACSIADGAGFLRSNQAEEDQPSDNAVEVTEDYIHVRVKDPKSLHSYSTIWISKSKGIKARIGKPEGKTTTTVQVYLFDKKKWTAEKAKAWVAKHKKSTTNALVLNEMSHEETRQLLQSALRETDQSSWVEEVHDKFFIYESDGKLYKQDYNVDDGIISFVGLHKLVQRKVTYEEVTQLAAKQNKTRKGPNMDKQQMIDVLIKNERTSWTEEHRDALMELDEDILTNVTKDIEELSKPVEPQPKPTPTKTEPKETASAEPQTNAEPQPETMEEYIAKAPPEIRESLRMSVNAMQTEKSRLIKVILANEANDFTEEHLKTLDIKMLTAIARLATPVENADGDKPRAFPLYLGQAEPSNPDVQAPEPLQLPVMNFGEEQQKTA